MGFGEYVRAAILRRGLHFSITYRFGWGKIVPNYHFFTDKEVEGLDKELCAMLDWARGRAAIPFNITCGLRTPDHNTTVGGVQDSAHLKGLGVDLACDTASDRFLMVQALMLAGFKRIGVYDKHVHVDRDNSLPQLVMWTGISH